MAGSSKPTALNRHNLAGWLMAAPIVVLMFAFLVTPFLLGVGLSFTNQRLVSPNPTEFVGLDNFSRLLGVGVLVMEPERDDAGAV